jgi:hypothetical protein
MNVSEISDCNFLEIVIFSFKTFFEQSKMRYKYIKHNLPSTRCVKVDYQYLQRLTKYYKKLYIILNFNGIVIPVEIENWRNWAAPVDGGVSLTVSPIAVVWFRDVPMFLILVLS